MFTNLKENIVTSNRILYTASSFARSSLLHLQEIGTLQANEPHTSSRASLASFLFFVVNSGSGVLKYDGKEYHLKAGDAAFIDCSVSYAHSTDNDLWSLSWIHFNGPTASEVYNKYLSRGGRNVLKATEAFFVLYNDLYEIASSDDYIRDMKINALLSNMLVLLMENSWNPDESKAMKKDVLYDVKMYLEENYARHISLDELASHFFISKYYLTRVFKERYGISINTYLLNIRVTQAKKLLRFSNETIENIGLQCGLGAANYFSSTFKKVEGISPKQYRKLW